MPLSKKSNYKRILLKLSGEALAGDGSFGIDLETVRTVAEELKQVRDQGVEIAIVVGGGNIFRGLSHSEQGMDRVNCDFMGMLGTCINALALQDILEQSNISTRVMSAIEISDMAEPYIRRKALRHLEKKRIVIFSAGTGNPYFTTDTAASLRAMEIKADVLLKATKVDGVFDSDPMKSKNSKRFKSITYMDVLNKGLKFIDSTAVSLCMDNKMPLVIFNLKQAGNLLKIIQGEQVGTVIS